MGTTQPTESATRLSDFFFLPFFLSVFLFWGHFMAPNVQGHGVGEATSCLTPIKSGGLFSPPPCVLISRGAAILSGTATCRLAIVWLRRVSGSGHFFFPSL